MLDGNELHVIVADMVKACKPEERLFKKTLVSFFRRLMGDQPDLDYITLHYINI